MGRMMLLGVVAGAVIAAGALRTSWGRVASAAAVTRVACVGDSITFGSGTKTPRTDSFPAQLGRMLGDGYSVSNFGVGGTTLLNDGDHPYQKTGAMRRAMESTPDVVVIMLGTNDTKPHNWKFKDKFVADYKELIGRFKGLESRPKIYICLPPFVPKEGNFGINEAGVEEEIPMIRKVAEEEKVGVIDNYAPLKGRDELLPDNVHPNNEGAAELAKSVYQGITGKKFEGEVPAATQRAK